MKSPGFAGGPILQQYHHNQHHHLGPAFNGNTVLQPPSYSPTSIPQHLIPPQPDQFNYNYQQSPRMATVKHEDDDEYMPNAPAVASSKRPRDKGQQQLPGQPSQPTTDPTLGVTLRTSFPVARIKRLMQADEDIGKVAQVTPHAVSRALELFMIKLISTSAQTAAGGGAGGGKGPRKVLAQHMKRAIQADDTFDFLGEIAQKVPDAPSKAAKKEGSDSDEAKPVKKRAGGGKRRRDFRDDM